jgi:nicotinate-nucleotide pyrophosphorylase (carboxylating)
VDRNARTLIDLALAEDIGGGDVTSRYFVPEDRIARAFVIARAEGMISGTEMAQAVFRTVDASLDVAILVPDGSRVAPGAMVLRVEGSARSILTAERTALNFLQRLSGVATLTRRYVDAIAGTGAAILDTRKTTPGYRTLEKAAVVHGGGTNHRIGLFDRAMVKDNHLVAESSLPGLQASIAELKADRPEVEVELEADRLEQVEAFFGLEGVDYLLLDNMSLEDLRAAVAMRNGRTIPRLEASGGVNLETVRGIAETGVDFISVGALTHSAPSLDLGLDFVPVS